MRLPRDISPGAASRRALLADALAAVLLTAAAILVAAGIGVVGFAALAAFLGLGAWIAIEAMVRTVSRRRRRRAVNSEPRGLPPSDELDRRRLDPLLAEEKGQGAQPGQAPARPTS